MHEPAEQPSTEAIEKLRLLLQEAGNVADEAIAFSAQRVRVCADIGATLTAWQKQMGKGTWGRFVAEHYPELNERTRQRWMRLAQLRDAGKLDFESCKSMRQAYTLAQMLPESDTSNTKSSKTADGWLVHLARLVRSLELLDLEKLTAPQRSAIAQRLDAVPAFIAKLRA